MKNKLRAQLAVEETHTLLRRCDNGEIDCGNKLKAEIDKISWKYDLDIVVKVVNPIICENNTVEVAVKPFDNWSRDSLYWHNYGTDEWNDLEWEQL